MSLRLVTPATALAVSLSEAKAHLRVDSADEDTLITAMITSATEAAEQITGRAIMPQTWEYSDDDFDKEIELTRVPVTAVTSFTYVDLYGVTQTLAPEAYILDNADDYSVAEVTPVPYTYWPMAMPQPNSVKLRFTAGYANAAAVPQPIKNWILLTVAALFENREAESYSARAVSTTVKMSFVDALLDRYRVLS